MYTAGCSRSRFTSGWSNLPFPKQTRVRVFPGRLTFTFLYGHHVGRGAALDDGVADQVAALKDRSHQLRQT